MICEWDPHIWTQGVPENTWEPVNDPAPRVMQLNENCYLCLKAKPSVCWVHGLKTFRILQIWKSRACKPSHVISASSVLEPVQPQEGSERILSIYKCLSGGREEDGICLLSVVFSEGTRGSGHKVQKVQTTVIPVQMHKIKMCLQGWQRLEPFAQRCCGVSILRDIQSLKRCSHGLLVALLGAGAWTGFLQRSLPVPTFPWCWDEFLMLEREYDGGSLNFEHLELSKLKLFQFLKIQQKGVFLATDHLFPQTCQAGERNSLLLLI